MQQNESQPVKPVNQPSGGYGQKGGWKKWLLIYVVIAIVVYGGYYFFKQSGGSTGTGY